VIDWILQHQQITIFILSTFGSTIVWSVGSYLKLKVQLTAINNTIKSNKVLVDVELKRFKESVDSELKAFREELKIMEKDQADHSEQIREDIRGIQLNVRDLTLAVSRLVGFLEGKQILVGKSISIDGDK
jgi:hypothetical protein